MNDTGASETLPLLRSRCDKLIPVLVGVAFAIGAAALVGWILGIDTLKRIHPALVTMKANTAICLMLAAASVWLQRHESTAGLQRRLAQAGAVVIAAVGTLTLAEHLLGWDLGIDRFLFHETVAEAGQSFPGRMGVAASLNFTLLGLALLFLDRRICGRYLGGTFTGAGAAVVFLVFLYYFYNVEKFEPIARYATIAFHTVVAFFCLCLAIFLARPERGMMAALLKNEVGSVVARRMLPAAVLLPVLLGWMRVMGQHAGIFRTGLGTAIYTTIIVIFFTGLIWWTAVSLNRADAQRRKSEEALRESESRLRLALESAKMGMWFTDLKQGLTDSTALNKTFFGLAPDHPIQTSDEWLALVHPEDRAEILHAWNRAVAQNADYFVEYRVVWPDGSVRFLESRGHFHSDAGGTARGIIGVTLDITQRRRAEEALRENEQRLQLHMENSPLAVIEWDRNFVVTRWAGEAAQMFGWVPEEVIGKTIAELSIVHEPDVPVLHGVMAQLTDGASRQVVSTNRNCTRDGRVIRCIWRNSVLFDAKGQIASVLSLVEDVTERSRMEVDLRAAHEQLANRAVHLENLVQERTARLRETVDELEHVSYSIAHDMRAPLRAMSVFAGILNHEVGRGAGLPPEARDYSTRIVSAAARLDSLIQDALHYTQAVLHETPLRPVDLGRLIRDLIESYPNLQADSADVRIEGQLPVVHGNEALLTQCFANLLGNAVKFVPPGVRPVVRLRAEPLAASVRVWVEDNGIGIPPHQRKRLFGMFQRLNDQYEGTGIGLAIVRKVVERMGGKVGVESNAGQGSRFWVELCMARVHQMSSRSG